MPPRNTAPEDAVWSGAGRNYALRLENRAGGARPVRKGNETWAGAAAIDTTTVVLSSTGPETGGCEKLAARE